MARQRNQLVGVGMGALFSAQFVNIGARDKVNSVLVVRCSVPLDVAVLSVLLMTAVT